MNIKQELELLIEKYKDKNFFTFEINYVNMAKDCLREINRLERENIELRKQLKEHIDNPPLRFDELEEGMWIYDKLCDEYMLVYAVIGNYADVPNQINVKRFGYIDFTENRFYRKRVEE